MNTNTLEALAKVASISDMLESFAKSLSMQRIDIEPIAMMGSHDGKTEDSVWETYHDDTLTMMGQDDRHRAECLGCMDCLGMSWRDFL